MRSSITIFLHIIFCKTTDVTKYLRVSSSPWSTMKIMATISHCTLLNISITMCIRKHDLFYDYVSKNFTLWPDFNFFQITESNWHILLIILHPTKWMWFHHPLQLSKMINTTPHRFDMKLKASCPEAKNPSTCHNTKIKTQRLLVNQALTFDKETSEWQETVRIKYWDFWTCTHVHTSKRISKKHAVDNTLPNTYFFAIRISHNNTINNWRLSSLSMCIFRANCVDLYSFRRMIRKTCKERQARGCTNKLANA